MNDLKFTPPREPSAELDVVAKHITSDSDAVRGASWVPLSQIHTHPQLEQRTLYRNVDELAASIKEHGQLEPIGLWQQTDRDEPYYYVIWGHTRRRALLTDACRGLDAFARIYRQLDLEQARQLAFVENFKRNDLSLYDQARQIRTSLKNGWTQSTIESLTGLGRRSIYRLDLLYQCGERSAAFRDLSQEPRFPLRAAEVFHAVEGWRIEEGVLRPLLELLVSDQPLSLNAFKTQLRRLQGLIGTQGAAEAERKPLVDVKGNFRLPAMRLSSAASADELQATIDELGAAVKALRSLRRKALKRDAPVTE